MKKASRKRGQPREKNIYGEGGPKKTSSNAVAYPKKKKKKGRNSSKGKGGAIGKAKTSIGKGGPAPPGAALHKGMVRGTFSGEVLLQRGGGRGIAKAVGGGENHRKTGGGRN